MFCFRSYPASLEASLTRAALTELGADQVDGTIADQSNKSELITHYLNEFQSIITISFFSDLTIFYLYFQSKLCFLLKYFYVQLNELLFTSSQKGKLPVSKSQSRKLMNVS